MSKLREYEFDVRPEFIAAGLGPLSQPSADPRNRRHALPHVKQSPREGEDGIVNELDRRRIHRRLASVREGRHGAVHVQGAPMGVEFFAEGHVEA